MEYEFPLTYVPPSGSQEDINLGQSEGGESPYEKFFKSGAEPFFLNITDGTPSENLFTPGSTSETPSRYFLKLLKEGYDGDLTEQRSVPSVKYVENNSKPILNIIPTTRESSNNEFLLKNNYRKIEYSDLKKNYARPEEDGESLTPEYLEELLAEVEQQTSLYTRKLEQKAIELERQKQRKAHSFRSVRMRFGELGSITRSLQLESRVALKKGVSAVVGRAGRMLQKTQAKDEMHRAYAPLIAGLMGEPETRRQFIEGIDSAVSIESDSLKQEARLEPLDTDMLVVGGGVHGAIFTSRLRDEAPEVKILTTDKAHRLGGQFRSYGTRPVFRINSRNFREQDTNVDGLPGQNGNLNSFGVKAPLQITDVSYETYPTNIDIGEVAAVNQYLSSQALVGVEVVTVRENPTNSGRRYNVVLCDAKTKEVYEVCTDTIVASTGLGERSLGQQPIENVWSAEKVLSHFGNPDNLFPMDAFEGKNVVIKGGGDTGRVIAELLTRLGPKEAYGKSNVQLGGPSEIKWYGTEFSNQEEFVRTNRSRYQQLASFIFSPNKPKTINTIVPTTLKTGNMEPLADGRIRVYDERGTQADSYVADVVIDCTQLTNDSLEAFSSLGVGIRSVAEIQYVEGRGYLEVAKRIEGHSIFLCGPVGNLFLTPQERSTFAESIKENTAAIWANGIRTESLAKRLAANIYSKDRLNRPILDFTTRSTAETARNIATTALSNYAKITS